MKQIRIILNGKKAGLDYVRNAIVQARKSQEIEVRVTWESGDVARLVNESCNDKCQRLVIGGGDGSVKEIVEALMQLPVELKNFFGGGAYTFNGMVQALNFIPYKGKLFLPEGAFQVMLLLALCVTVDKLEEGSSWRHLLLLMTAY